LFFVLGFEVSSDTISMINATEDASKIV